MIPAAGPFSMTDEEVFARAAEGDQHLLLDWYRRRGRESPFFFSKVIAGYHDLTPDLHAPVCQWLVDSESDLLRGILFPRKYFKSSMTKGYVLRILTGEHGAEERILFVGENDDVGAKNLQDIQWKIRNDKLFQALYPHLIPDDLGRDWPSDSMTLPRSRSYDEPTIRSVGIGTKHTGFHYTRIVYDDPIGLVAAKSKPEMQKAIDWFQAAPGLHDSNLTQELYVGTRWKHGKADLPGWIMEELPYQIVDGQHEGYKWFVRSAIENGQSIFPPQISSTGKHIGYSLRDLGLLKKRMKTYLFNANMMNNPTAGDDTDFKEAWIKTYRISEDRKAVILEDTGERVELGNLIRISVYDPSTGGVSAEAENAIVVIGCDCKGRIFVLDSWSKNCSMGVAVEQWHVMNDKWRCWRNWYEAVGAHKEVAEIFKNRPSPCRCGKTHKRMRPNPILPPPGSKEDRIRDYAQIPFEEGRVYFATHMTVIQKQVTDFPHGDLVDLLDALAYAISKARRSRVGGTDDNDRGAKKDPPRRAAGGRTHSTVDYGGY